MGVKPVSPSLSLLHRHEICFIIVESTSSSWNPLCRCWIFIVIIGSSSSSLDRRCHRWIVVVVVEPTFLVSNLGGVVAWWHCLLQWPGVRYRTGQWDGRNKGIAKTNHDGCCDSCFVMHFMGLPNPGSPLMFPPSLVPSSGEDEPPTSLWRGEGRMGLWSNVRDRWGC